MAQVIRECGANAPWPSGRILENNIMTMEGGVMVFSRDFRQTLSVAVRVEGELTTCLPQNVVYVVDRWTFVLYSMGVQFGEKNL